MNVRTSLFKLMILFFAVIALHFVKAQKVGGYMDVKDFQQEDYKLFFKKDYRFISKKNSIFIFEKDHKRKFVLCENVSSSKRKIIALNDDMIYPGLSDCDQNSLNKITQKRLYFTIEQTYCTNKGGQYLKEYFTFKYNSKMNNFLLDKYSFNLVNSLPADDSLPPKKYIEDKFPTEVYTEKDFGQIEINNFNLDSIKTIREKYLEDK